MNDIHRGSRLVGLGRRLLLPGIEPDTGAVQQHLCLERGYIPRIPDKGVPVPTPIAIGLVDG